MRSDREPQRQPNMLSAEGERKALEAWDREHAWLTEPDEPLKWCDGCGENLRLCTCPEVVSERDAHPSPEDAR